jgi:cytoskeletal protein RodZ
VEEIVTLLKQARQDKGISLEEVSVQTKIQLRYLEALENNDFSLFAGEVYLKGALRNYAEIVGLDPNEVLSLYHRLKNVTAVDAAEQEPAQVQEERRPEPKRTAKPAKEKRPHKREGQGPSLTAGVALLVLAFIVAGIWFSQNYEWPDLRPPDQAENNAPGDNGAADNEEPEPEPQTGQQVSVASSSPGETAFAVSGFSEIEISLSFQAPCWVLLVVDGTEPFYPRIFQPGENYSATALETVRLRMGNPPAVRMTVNGLEIMENRELTNPHNFRFNLE